MRQVQLLNQARLQRHEKVHLIAPLLAQGFKDGSALGSLTPSCKTAGPQHTSVAGCAVSTHRPYLIAPLLAQSFEDGPALGLCGDALLILSAINHYLARGACHLCALPC